MSRVGYIRLGRTMMGLCRWKCTMQATSDLVAFWNSACRMFLQSSPHFSSHALEYLYQMPQHM